MYVLCSILNKYLTELKAIAVIIHIVINAFVSNTHATNNRNPILKSFFWKSDSPAIIVFLLFVSELKFILHYRSGKTSISKVVFQKMSPHETFFLLPTGSIEN